MPLDAVLFGPAEHGVRCELGAVVADDHRRPAKQGNQTVQFTGYPHARERGIDLQRQAFPREVIDHDEDPEAASVDEDVGYEVQRPALVPALRDRHRRSCSQRPLPAAALPNRQPLLPIDTVELLVVHDDALPFQQDVQSAIAEPTADRRQFPQTRPNAFVVTAP